MGLAKEGQLLTGRTNTRQNDHAAWLHPAIKELMEETNVTFSDLKAIGITGGPGSYTGLRVGVAAAKGICYVQQIPLIAVSTLQLLAAGVRAQAKGLILSLIDARRDEVYAGLYDPDLNPIQPDQARFLNPAFFSELPHEHPVVLTGNGANKTFAHTATNKNFFVLESKQSLEDLALITYKKFLKGTFENLAYYEPAYLKDFYLPANGK